MDALVDVDDLADAAIPRCHHHLIDLALARFALLGQKFSRFADENVECLVQIPVEADGDPRVFGFDTRPFERYAFDHIDGNVHLLVCGLERGEVDLAVALRRVRITGPQQRAFDKNRNVQRRAFGHVADIEIPAVASRRHRTVLTGLGAGDAKDTGKRRQRNFNPRRKLCDLALEVEVKILDLTFGKFSWKLPEHAGDVEIGSIGARHDLVDAYLEDITGLGAFDIDRARQCVRSAAGKIGAQFLDLVDRHPGHDLVVRVHHRLEHDRIAGRDIQHRRLRIVEPAPLRGFHRRRQQVNLARKAPDQDQPQLVLIRGDGWHKGQDSGRWRRGGSRWCGRRGRRGGSRRYGLLRAYDNGGDCRDKADKRYGARSTNGRSRLDQHE